MRQSSEVRRILVVDDKVDAAEMVGQIMSMKGYAVALANDGFEALAAVEGFFSDVVLLDIGMPGIDGYEVAFELRGNAALSAARIVALTAWGHPASRAQRNAASMRTWSSLPCLKTC